MKILIIGKTGQLGGDLLRHGRAHELIAPDRKELDITDSDAIFRVIQQSLPDVVINTAAFHYLPHCEQHAEAAFLSNCIAVKTLAMACREFGVRLLTFSSDYVFSGDKGVPYVEEDALKPLQMYGISRAAGEFAALCTAPDHAIVIRTSGLYGISGALSKGGNFVDARLEDSKTHSEIEISCEQIVSPTYTEDLALAVYRLIEHPSIVPGIYHLVNEGWCSWSEFTQSIYALAGVSTVVHPINRGGISGTVRRPLFSVLANTKAKKFGIELPHWRQALARYLHEKYGIKPF